MNFNIDEKKRQLVILLLAIAMGGLAAGLGSNYIRTTINRQTEQLAKDFKAKSDAEKEILKQQMMKLYQDMDVKIKQAVEEVKKAAPKEARSEKSPAVALSTKMPPGKRAMTISINPLSAVGGLLNPGDFVDVLVELQMPNPQRPASDKDQVTSIIFQNIQVLAMDTQVSPGTNEQDIQNRLKAKAINVTLAVSPDEAGLLTFAQANGKIILSLRSPGEKGTQKVDAATLETLLDYVEKTQGTKLRPAPPKREAPAEAPKQPVKIFKSGLEY